MGKIVVQAKVDGKAYTAHYEGAILDEERASMAGELMRSIHEMLAKEGKDDSNIKMRIMNEW